LFLGTDVRKQEDATIPKETFYRHAAVLGVTGYGKSTLLTNNMKQLIEAGNGLCFIDPKGDDSERLAEIIPEDRRDDVIWIEPGGSGDLISGFNFINVGLPPDHPHIETAVSALVFDLKKMLGDGEY
jgi:DNA helicase HerA-like ATPase